MDPILGRHDARCTSVHHDVHMHGATDVSIRDQVSQSPSTSTHSSALCGLTSLLKRTVDTTGTSTYCGELDEWVGDRSPAPWLLPEGGEHVLGDGTAGELEHARG